MISIQIILVIFLWASAFVVIGGLVETVDPIVIAVVRNIVASFIFVILRFSSLIEDFKLIIKNAKIIILAGLTGIAGYNVLLNFGQIYIDPATASFLINIVPVFTLAGAVLLKWEKISILTIIAFLICMTGAIVVSLSRGAKVDNWSLASLLVLGAAVCQAVYFLLVKFISQKLSPFLITMGAIWVGSVILLIFSFKEISNHPFTRNEIIGLIYLGVGPSTIAFLLWSYVLKSLDASLASVFLFVVPIVAFLMEYFIFSEIPAENTLIGCIIILIGLIVLRKKEIYYLLKLCFKNRQ